MVALQRAMRCLRLSTCSLRPSIPGSVPAQSPPLRVTTGTAVNAEPYASGQPSLRRRRARAYSQTATAAGPVTANTTSPPVRARRAMLYVPGSSLKMLAKAFKLSGDHRPDVLVLDLEDSVAANAKGQARRNVHDVLQTASGAASQLYVRVNSGELGLEDLEVVLKSPHLDGILLPKVDEANQVRRVDAAIDQHGLEDLRDNLKLIASVESPLSLLNLRDIATSSKRLDGLLFAAEDYCAASNLLRTESRMEMLFARSSVVTVAKAYGLSAIDLVRIEYKGPSAIEGLETEAREGRQLGFDGKQCIHPSQVATVQRAFTPSETEVERAQKILKLYDESGVGAYGLESAGATQMIDAPMLLQAEKILAQARAAGQLADGGARKNGSRVGATSD